MKTWCVSIEIGVGILSILSTILGVAVVAISFQETLMAVESTVNSTELNIKMKINIGDVNINSTYKTYISTKDMSMERFNQEFLEQIRPLWLGASFAGIITGTMQVVASLWFILNIRAAKEKQVNNAKWWIRLQLGSTFVLMTTFGALIIQGVLPELMIHCFVADFILTNVFVWLSVPILRLHSDNSEKPVLRGPLWSTF